MTPSKKSKSQAKQYVSSDFMSTLNFKILAEFLSCIALFPLFWPIPAMMHMVDLPFLPKNLYLYAYHALGVVVADITMFGSFLNPAMVFSAYCTNIISLPETLGRISAQLVAAMLGFKILREYLFLPAFIVNSPYMGGPELPPYLSPLLPALAEGALTALLTILFNLNYKYNHGSTPFYLLVRRINTALALRAMITLGSLYGAGIGNMNPLVSLAWLVSRENFTLDQRIDYCVVFIIAPIIGSIIGALTLSLSERYVQGYVNKVHRVTFPYHWEYQSQRDVFV